MSVADDLHRLAELHARGALSDAEYESAKARVLGGQPAAAPAWSAAPEGGVGAVNGLRRSTSDRWLGGVCGGLAQVTGLAAWAWRLIFVLAAVFAGTGVLLYVLLWIFVPQEPPLYLPGPRTTP